MDIKENYGKTNYLIMNIIYEFIYLYYYFLKNNNTLLKLLNKKIYFAN